MTLNNIQAVLDKNITFYTKLQGEKVAKLESITTGSLLRVTPRLLNDNGTQKIMLNLNIQDGQQSDTQSETDPLPEVQNLKLLRRPHYWPDKVYCWEGLNKVNKSTRKTKSLYWAIFLL